MATLTIPTLSFLIHDDGTWAVCAPWPSVVVFTDDLLARADGRRLSVLGDEVTIRCTNGGAVYALVCPVGPTGVRAGRLLRIWD